MKSILILIGFVLAFLVIYLGYRMDKREEMHLRKIHMAKEKKYKSNKKQIDNMISKFTKVGTNKSSEKIEEPLPESVASEENEVSNMDAELTEVADLDIADLDINNIDISDLDVNDIDLDNIDVEKSLLEEAQKNFDEESLFVDDTRDYVEDEEVDEIEEIKSIHIDEPEKENLEMASKDIVASIVKGYDYNEEDISEEETKDVAETRTTFDDIAETDFTEEEITEIIDDEQDENDGDENSQVEELMDIIKPKRYTRKKNVVQEKKNIKRYTRKKSGRKSKKKGLKKYYSTGIVLSRKPKKKHTKIEIEDTNDTNEYVDYKEILNIIEPVGIKDEKDVKVVTVDISDIEPFMPKREPAQKRGRGRPRKEVTEEKPKRGRGRPRKEVTEVKPKRKRGRPRKDENTNQEQ